MTGPGSFSASCLRVSDTEPYFTLQDAVEFGSRKPIDEVRDDEQESYDNLPESFQEGESGEKMQLVIDTLDEAMSFK